MRFIGLDIGRDFAHVAVVEGSGTARRLPRIAMGDEFRSFAATLGPDDVVALEASTNTWAVNLDFDSTGTKQFADVTSRLYPQAEPKNRFAVTLDGYVITAPTTNAVITGGSAQITGNFDKLTSKALADSLKYGSLPIGFEVQSQENISATLGSEQLASGLLAGAVKG